MFGISKSDYINLSLEIKNNFNEYAKPYPNETIIRQNFYDNKRWIKFKNA